MLSLEEVGLQIPVFTTETRSLKSALIRSVTGGQLRRGRSGAVITALRSVNCTVREGERVALIGHNGAGKSTFLKLISGIYTATSGRFQRQIRVFPMIQKSFITSPELSGLQAIKAHYLMVQGNLRGFDGFCDGVIEFSGLGDEGFGAGDFSFYEKAQQRMQAFIEQAGTLFLASHSDALLKQFCQRGLVFDQGSIAFDGPLDQALSYYHARR